MAFSNIQAGDRDSVRTITITRPDKLNALNRATINELQCAFDEARLDPSVRVVVLAGAGDKAFVAGADIGELAALSPLDALAFARAGQTLMHRIETLGKPVIARIQGFALGGGMEIAMACHVRIGSAKARLGQPEINLGVIPGFGGTQRLLRLAGRAAALELCLLGAPIGAERALQLGLLTRMVAHEKLDSEVTAIADQLARSAPHALAGILDAVLTGGEGALDLGLDYEAHAFALCCASADMREGTQAFLERRRPAFSGT
ncbi:MAG: enoyl-CoA hydratase-related protein [Rhodanobacteraceae bacterium]